MKPTGLSLFVLCWVLLPLTAGAEEGSAGMTGSEAMQRGLASLEQGKFEEAALAWDQAARHYETAQDGPKQREALLRLSEAFYQLGQYQRAEQVLRYALELADQSGDPIRKAWALGRLGNIYLALGNTTEAERLLKKGITVARREEDSGLTAALLNDLGNVFVAQQTYPQAVAAYTESTLLADAAHQDELAVRAQINASRTSIESQDYQDARDRLALSTGRIQALPDSHDKAYEYLSVGLAYLDLRPHLPHVADDLLKLAAQAFQQGIRVARMIGDGRAESYGWGYLGGLYEEEGRYRESLELTRKAILLAQEIKAPESLYRWEWQTARLLKQLGQNDEAVLAYRRAVYTLQPIRRELSFGYQGGEHSFRRAVGPLFFELADLLLARSRHTATPEEQEALLFQVRDTIEGFKAAELQDYFRDDCVEAAQSAITRIDEISQTRKTAVIYPIIFPDRLELLVTLGGSIRRVTVNVSEDRLTQDIYTFRKRLEKRTTHQYLPYAQKIYDVLIRPLEPALKEFDIDTLVFLPDGPLRTIPMGPLHDGKKFLIEKYAIAMTPGLTLTDPEPINRGNVRLLSVGLTEGVQGFPPLPNVAEEVQAIQTMYGGEILLNDRFVVSNVEKEMKKEEFTIVHIASHGKFEKNVKNTFILAFDDKLTMDRLDELIGLFQFRESPLDLLTLSACQTAAGDDRAALGLAGVAIKAGARSALATLWFINDRASSNLVKEFYRELRNPNISKARALQLAQLKLLEHPVYRHPSYWSPFLLLNNWL